MLTSLKGMSAALTTVGIAASLTGTLATNHNAAAARTPRPVVKPVASIELASFSTKLRTEVHHGTSKSRIAAHRVLHRAAVAAQQPSGTPQQMAETLVADRGWDGSQWSCLNELWTRESGWNVHADNAESGAYGIPQALPATKMAVEGSDYENDPLTQIKWGLGYIAGSYGTPCGALEQSNESGYY